MDISEATPNQVDDIVTLFRVTFTHSEGEAEGALIGQLAHDLMHETQPDQICAVVSSNGGTLTGCIIFTQLNFADDARTTFLLAPVAVAPNWQRQGVGQRLITHGLNVMRSRGVAFAITYGDPAYYGKTGFRQIDDKVVQPPRPLRFPHGWLGQSLSDRPISSLQGASRCVPAFDDPDLW